MGKVKEQFNIRLLEEDVRNLPKLYIDQIDNILEGLQRNNLSIEETMIPVFANHVVVLLVRLFKNEQLTSDLPDDSITHVSQESVDISNSIMETVENEVGINVSSFEKFLFGIYIEISLKERRKS